MFLTAGVVSGVSAGSQRGSGVEKNLLSLVFVQHPIGNDHENTSGWFSGVDLFTSEAHVSNCDVESFRYRSRARNNTPIASNIVQTLFGIQHLLGICGTKGLDND